MHSLIKHFSKLSNKEGRDKWKEMGLKKGIGGFVGVISVAGSIGGLWICWWGEGSSRLLGGWRWGRWRQPALPQLCGTYKIGAEEPHSSQMVING